MCLPRPRRHHSCKSSSSSSSISNVPYRRLRSPPPTPRTATRSTVSPAPATAAMPGPAGLPRAVSSQHERLLLELLPFRDPVKFHEWLGSNFVRGPWNEFTADYLSRVGGGGASGAVCGIPEPEPDKATIAQAAREALNSRNPKFLVYHPDKAGWAAEDHHVRFVVTLVSNNILKNLWYESEWKKRGLDIAKAAFEVLMFLKTTTWIDPNPPSYSA